uniref:Uncharacterized protein n=1 Tax=Rhizophora mucronata TaxID=61149 RepID=A0A2P2PUL8_RHIMU
MPETMIGSPLCSNQTTSIFWKMISISCLRLSVSKTHLRHQVFRVKRVQAQAL